MQFLVREETPGNEWHWSIADRRSHAGFMQDRRGGAAWAMKPEKESPRLYLQRWHGVPHRIPIAAGIDGEGSVVAPSVWNGDDQTLPRPRCEMRQPMPFTEAQTPDKRAGSAGPARRKVTSRPFDASHAVTMPDRLAANELERELMPPTLSMAPRLPPGPRLTSPAPMRSSPMRIPRCPEAPGLNQGPQRRRHPLQRVACSHSHKPTAPLAPGTHRLSNGFDAAIARERGLAGAGAPFTTAMHRSTLVRPQAGVLVMPVR
ncbi:uncharacterized protein BDZ99DRAFT_475665 [Mytilinidion resinicola]|uniref:Uncharacterized protein n=1 Tax=Mytilinidion resinicola TaxID=574789 RepID=A0A6A6YQH5_9PEZI|nr:uncharacterized protein BDZ99DRAFT_475665 [Mytilinidion resinicola]KAF2810783.1 hypothetical protein BDZ99DRAFT_475665 [Mytilinidion resinicola]